VAVRLGLVLAGPGVRVNPTLLAVGLGGGGGGGLAVSNFAQIHLLFLKRARRKKQSLQLIT